MSENEKMNEESVGPVDETRGTVDAGRAVADAATPDGGSGDRRAAGRRRFLGVGAAGLPAVVALTSSPAWAASAGACLRNAAPRSTGDVVSMSYLPDGSRSPDIENTVIELGGRPVLVISDHCFESAAGRRLIDDRGGFGPYDLNRVS